MNFIINSKENLKALAKPGIGLYIKKINYKDSYDDFNIEIKTMEFDNESLKNLITFIKKVKRIGIKPNVFFRLESKEYNHTPSREEIVPNKLEEAVRVVSEEIRGLDISYVYNVQDKDVYVNSECFKRDKYGRYVDGLYDSFFRDEYRDFLDKITIRKSKNYFTVNKLYDFKVIIESGKIKENRNFEVEINLKEYNEEFIEVSKCFIDYVKKQNANLDFFIDMSEMALSVEQVEKNRELEAYANENGVRFAYLGEARDFYQTEQVLSATRIGKTIVDYINNTNATPLEKYLMVYKFLAQHRYYLNNEFSGKSRDVLSVLTQKDIVCAGYANLMKWICDRIGIKCEKQSLKSGIHGHRTNKIYIKDEKYGIDGWYYADSTWDSIGKDLFRDQTILYEDKTYNFCLVPFDKVKNIKKELNFIKIEDNLLFETGDFYNLDKIVYSHEFNSRNKIFKVCGEEFKIKEYNDVNISNKEFKECIDKLNSLLNKHNISHKIFDYNFGYKVIYKVILSLNYNVLSENEMVQYLKNKQDEVEKKLMHQNIDIYGPSENKNVENILSGKIDVENLHIELAFVNSLLNYRDFRRFLKQIKENSKYVSFDVIKEALINSYIITGLTREEAEKTINREMDVTQKRNPMCFKNDGDEGFEFSLGFKGE